MRNQLATAEGARARIRAALQSVNCALPSEEVSRMTGIPLHLVKNYLCRCEEFVNTGSKRCGMYVFVVIPPVAQVQSVSRMGGVYTGERAAPIRPGAEDFLQCHSIENGERIERKRPLIITTPAEQPRRYGPP